MADSRLEHDLKTDPVLLTVPECAVALRTGAKRIYTLCSERRLGHVRLGSRILISRASLEAFIESETVDPVTNEE